MICFYDKLQFGSTSAYSNSAAAQPAATPVEHDAAEDVDTVGWGSTKVGTLLKAKVRLGCCLRVGERRYIC